jgi:hypothetical protein
MKKENTQKLEHNKLNTTQMVKLENTKNIDYEKLKNQEKLKRKEKLKYLENMKENKKDENIQEVDILNYYKTFSQNPKKFKKNEYSGSSNDSESDSYESSSSSDFPLPGTPTKQNTNGKIIKNRSRSGENRRREKSKKEEINDYKTEKLLINMQRKMKELELQNKALKTKLKRYSK